MTDQYSNACCTTPAAVVGEYAPKGSWTEVNGIKTCKLLLPFPNGTSLMQHVYSHGETDVTGDPASTKAIIMVYDLFGYFPQTFQGADIIARQGKEPYLVFVPDFIGAERAGKLEWFLPGADKTPLQDLLAVITSDEMMASIHDAASALRSESKHAHIERWAGVGLCWGSKGISLITAKGEKSLLDVAVHSSPSRLDPEEAKTVTIPTMLLPSKAEEDDLVKRYVDNLRGEKYVEKFDEVHGWMSARYVFICNRRKKRLTDFWRLLRAKLGEEQPRREYERGYKLVLEWLAKFL